MTSALALLLLLGAPARANDFTSGALGTSGAQYLTVDVGPRAVGMGGAYTAVANDVYSMYWNPAGLEDISRSAVSFSQDKHPGPITYDFAGYGQRFTDSTVGAAAFRFMDAGSISATDIDGNPIGSIHPRAYVADLGYAQYLSELSDTGNEMTMGVAGRWSHSDLVAHSDLYCGDIGVQVRHSSDFLPWRFGGAMQNLGVGPKYESKRELLPMRGRLGVAVYPSKFWVFSVDASLPRDGAPSISAGTEVTLEAQERLQAFLRAGINSLTMTQGLGGFSGVSFGVGVKAFDLSFDYAYTPMGALGEAHLFSVSFVLPQLGSRRYRER
ncbi:MAG: PorV/PorQ family protein [Elusimicrobia bacterium]|nr:PorV/PorQ family protein [Elusimicrobiota bacterium]